jgi:hypothetical protein
MHIIPLKKKELFCRIHQFNQESKTITPSKTWIAKQKYTQEEKGVGVRVTQTKK